MTTPKSSTMKKNGTMINVPVVTHEDNAELESANIGTIEVGVKADGEAQTAATNMLVATNVETGEQVNVMPMSPDALNANAKTDPDLQSALKTLKPRTGYRNLPDSGDIPIILPLILAPIVGTIMCERAGIATSVQKFRKAVTDPVDGREWSVRFDGGQSDIVCTKSGADPALEQIFSQYERLRQVKQTANHHAARFKTGYAMQKDTDTPELREASRPGVEKMLKESDDADKAFAEFEQLHPECLAKRLTAELSQGKQKLASLTLVVEKTKKSCEEWQAKIDEVADPEKADNLKESLKACEDALQLAVSKVEKQKRLVDKTQKALAEIPVKNLGPVIINVPFGVPVTFVP